MMQRIQMTNLISYSRYFFSDKAFEDLILTTSPNSKQMWSMIGLFKLYKFRLIQFSQKCFAFEIFDRF